VGHDHAIRSVKAAGGGLLKMPYGPGRLETVGLCLPDKIAKQKKRRQVLTRGSGISWTNALDWHRHPNRPRDSQEKYGAR
jgi:hypothetical protein